jgi:colanic acid biosynthesis glycosyl transferase WcaI
MNFKESLGLKNKFLIVHSGNMGVKQGLEVILQAAQLSNKDRSLHYLLVGDGAVREVLENKARKMELRNLQFLPLLPDRQFKELLTATDVSLITQQRCVADIVFPSKVITLMASGRTIVASVSKTSEVARVLNDARAGLVVPPEDPTRIMSAVSALRDDASLRHEMARNAREFAKRTWDRDQILSKMESQLYALIASGAVKDSGRGRIWKLSRLRQKDPTSITPDQRREAISSQPEGR